MLIRRPHKSYHIFECGVFKWHYDLMILAMRVCYQLTCVYLLRCVRNIVAFNYNCHTTGRLHICLLCYV